MESKQLVNPNIVSRSRITKTKFSSINIRTENKPITSALVVELLQSGFPLDYLILLVVMIMKYKVLGVKHLSDYASIVAWIFVVLHSTDKLLLIKEVDIEDYLAVGIDSHI